MTNRTCKTLFFYWKRLQNLIYTTHCFSLFRFYWYILMWNIFVCYKEKNVEPLEKNNNIHRYLPITVTSDPAMAASSVPGVAIMLFQKISMPIPRKVNRNSKRGGGVSKAQFFWTKVWQWNGISGGVVGERFNLKPSVEGVWKFSRTTHCGEVWLSRYRFLPWNSSLVLYFLCY